jgi:hypothetical protein
VRINGRAELDLLYFVRMLVLLGFLFLFGLLVTVLAKIHQATDGRSRIGGYFDEIHALGSGHVDGVRERMDPELITVIADDADFAGTDLPVDPYERRWSGRTRRKRATQDALIS